MLVSNEILKRIKAKEAEIVRLEDQLLEIRGRIKEAQAYMQGLRDILPKVAKEENPSSIDDPAQGEIRPGSAPDQVRSLLTQRGKPLHITEILTALGRDTNKANRVSLGGTLARFVRDGRIFNRPAPNTFGLIGMDVDAAEQLPEGFGQ